MIPLLIVLHLFVGSSLTMKFNVSVNVENIYGTPYGDLVMTIPASHPVSLSLSDGSRDFEPNVAFNTTIDIPLLLGEVNQVLLQWDVVNQTQMMEVTNVTIMNEKERAIFCAESPIYLLYLSIQFSYTQCEQRFVL